MSKFCGSCATPLVSPRPDTFTKTVDTPFPASPPGTIISGKYRIIEQIGRGGMGLVFKAEDIRLRRDVALKFLPPDLMHDSRARERFVQEAQAASALDHPHICTIHEIGETDDGRMYINMACYEGESLKDRIDRGPLEPAEAVSVASQVAKGLAAAHARGIIHRDIKPGNIYITKDGVAKILDFGLAKLTGESRLTRPGHAVGTVAYISPEQLQGEEIDGRADLWSLGVVLYEMLSGTLPFSGDTEHAFVYAIVNKAPRIPGPLPETTPRDLVQVIEKALTKNPAKRFASAEEMAKALDTLLSGPAPTMTSGVTRFVDNIVRLVRRRRAIVAVGAVAILAAVFALTLLPESGKSVAFLPLTIVGGDASDQPFADGLSMFLARKLDDVAGRHRGSWVFPLDEILRYEVGEAGDARGILGAAIAVTGTVKRAGEQITLDLNAIESLAIRRLETVTESDSIANITTWQQDVVLAIANAVGFRTTEGDRTKLGFGSTTVPAAFESYLLGLGHFIRAETDEEVDAAIIAFEEALSADPSFAAAGADLAAAALLKSSLTGSEASAAEAEARCRDVIQRHPDFIPAHVELGRILRKLNKTNEAIEEFERVLELEPRSYEAEYQMALTLEEAGRPADAEAAFLRAFHSRPDYWATPANLAYFYYGRNDFRKAIKMNLKATRLCPENTLNWNNLGAAYLGRGDDERAESAFRKSNDEKQNPDACSNLGYLYYYQGRYADAVRMFEAAVGFDREYYVYWGNLADAYRFTPGNAENAEKAYRRAIELIEKKLATDPENPHRRASLATFLAKTGSLDRAVAEIEAVLESGPDDSSVLIRAVLTFELCDKRERALETLKKCVELGVLLDEVEKDPFFAHLREDTRYVEVVGEAVEAGKKRGRK